MNQKGFVNIILIVIIVALVGVGTYFVLNRQTTPQVPISTPLPTPTPSPTPTPLPSSVSNQIITLDYLYKNNITNYVGQKIVLKTKLNWEYCSLIHIPEDPEPPADTVKKICGQLTVNSKDLNYPTISSSSSDGGNFYVVSENLTKINDSNGYQVYSFNGVKFSKSQSFILTGFLHYRSSLNISESNLSNPKFIEQSNNPNYWSQTFEFEIIDVKKQ